MKCFTEVPAGMTPELEKKIEALRDVSVAALQRHAGLLPPVILRRCRHVVTENARTERAAAALETGDLALFGRLMAESHASLRTLYEVSSRELDAITELARSQPGCHGARMTGAGFGGCAVALVAAEAAPGFVNEVQEAYRRTTGRRGVLFATRAQQGARLVV